MLESLQQKNLNKAPMGRQEWRGFLRQIFHLNTNETSRSYIWKFDMKPEYVLLIKQIDKHSVLFEDIPSYQKDPKGVKRKAKYVI